jgi:transcriptional regulator with XRE-family HTH domain
MTREGEETPRRPPGTPGRNEDPRLYEALGRAIKTARTERGIERKELAAATGLSYAYLSDIESGRRRPSSKAIFAIAQALDMSPSELMRWTEQLTYRIAAEESLAAELAPAGPQSVRAGAPAALAAPAAASDHRRSWFAASLAEPDATASERVSRRTHLRGPSQTIDPQASLRTELERILDGLGPEDLELVLDLADRLAREHHPRG